MLKERGAKGAEHITRTKGQKVRVNFWSENLNKRDPLMRPKLDGRLTLIES
jgi:hypothetical protein